MDRRWIVFPTLAASMAAQTPTVSPAEKALRARAAEFFQLQLENKYRQAESLVATDARDDYYNGNKPKLEAFKIQKVEFLPDRKHARITILAKTTVLMMGAGVQKFDVPSVSSWKLENGKWCWYLDQELYRQTPFGTAKPKTGKEGGAAEAFTGFPAGSPKLEDFAKGVQMDKTSVVLVPGGPAQEVMVTNPLPSVVHVKMAPRSTPVSGLTVSPVDLEVKPGTQGKLVFTAEKGSQIDTFVDFTVEPLARTLTIKVTAAK